jgi:hypothetical protein
LHLFYAICGLSVYSINHVINPEPRYDFQSGKARGIIPFDTKYDSAWQSTLV